MRFACAVAILMAGLLPVAAQNAPAAQAPAAAAKKKPAAKPAARPATATAKQTYDAMSQAERVAIQSDLIWTGDYNGIADGEFNERSIEAVKAFQGRQGNKQTGVLNPQERTQLADAAKKQQRDVAGWQVIDDKATGARLGIPLKVVPQASEANGGSRWQSPKGEIVVETFRVNAPATTLAAVYEAQRKQPANRKASYNVIKGDFFVISGLQGLKKFYVRAGFRDGEVRGMTIYYDQAVEGTMDSIVVAMSSAFSPFRTGAQAQAQAPAVRRKVDYGTGVAVTEAGHIVTDADLLEGCNLIVVPGQGHAERLADDKESGLALIRVNGPRNLKPVFVSGEVARGADVTLVGIADPERQDGGAAISTSRAKLLGSGATRGLEPMPVAGFAGAAAVDNEQRFLGLVEIRPQKAEMVDAITVRRFLDAQQVKMAEGAARAENASAAIVRVICVRK